MERQNTPMRTPWGDIAPRLTEITDATLFGDVWQRPGLSPRDRSLITVASLIALYRTNELPFHLKKALEGLAGLKRLRHPRPLTCKDHSSSSGGIRDGAGVITHDAVDHDLETEHGDTGHRNDGHEALGAVHTIGSSERDGPENGYDQGNEKCSGNHDPVTFQGARSLTGTYGRCAAIPL